MFSQTVEYALRATVYLAMNNDAPQKTVQIAAATQVPTAYLSKILRELNRQGLICSLRGPGGGMSLAKAPDEMRILEIVNAVDPVVRIKTCPLRLNSHGMQLCALHKRMDNALAMIESAFGETTLAEILSESRERAPLCNTDVDQLQQ